MNPIRSTQLGLRFASDISPWWLLLLVPAVMLVAAALLRRQFPDVRGSRAFALAALRMLLLAAVAVLAFRPDIVLTETLTWLGRVIVLVDNSASMAVNDPSLAADEALLVARSLDEKLEPREEHDKAERILAAVEAIDRFEPVSRDGSRESDSFWKQAEAAERLVGERLAEAGASDLVGVAGPLFSGQSHPGSRAFADVRQRLTQAAAELRRARADRDRELLTADAAAAGGLASALADIRGRKRIDLVRAMLDEAPDSLADQSLEIVSLAGTGDPFAIEEGGTDIGAALARIAAVPNAAAPASQSPINAIVLVSDGRDTASPARPVADVLALLAERKAPVIACTAGGATEPTDLAVLDVGMPPIAVADAPLKVAARVKTAVAEPAQDQKQTPGQVRLRLRREAAAVLAEAGVAAGTRPTETVAMSFTPERQAAGTPDARFRIERLAVDVDQLPGEVVPAANNRRDAVVAVAPEKLRVLLLDAVPRWETRFAINILRRLPFVDLNAIIASTRPDGKLVRDVRQGTWPADDATLSLSSVVILGNVPADMLTQGERDALDRWVKEQGGTLVRLAAGPPLPLPPEEWQLRRTEVGRAHPLTRRMNVPLLDTTDTAEPAPAATDAATPLLVTLDPTGGPPLPLIAVARDGAGKRVTVATDELWRVLNPQDLDAHTALYAELVTWAATARPAVAAPEADGFVATDREPISIVLPADAAADATVEAVSGDAVVASVKARDGVAVVPPQKPGQLRLRIAGSEAASAPVEIVADDPELTFLARNDAWLSTLATRTGGGVGSLADLPRFIRSVPPKSHVERRETVWRPWNSGWTIALLGGLLILEWIWRKWEGLV
jgi:hypothetical protein